jgi:hypothetical protein
MKTSERSHKPLSDDERLRSWGYSIAARPADGVALWFSADRRGIVTQEEALAEIRRLIRGVVESEARKNSGGCKGK